MCFGVWCDDELLRLHTGVVSFFLWVGISFGSSFHLGSWDGVLSSVVKVLKGAGLCGSGIQVL